MMQPSQPSETEQASSLAAQLAPVFRRVAIALAWVLTLALGALPPLLVLLDRWFKTPYLRDAVRKTWCQVDFLCQTPLPSYFLWIFPAWLAFTGLALWATRGQPLDARGAAQH
ncbi:MAG: hypothetical protein EG825_13810, partial [Rhodocyclaceae bacterium]|nr:hypothetical protein [Rhodocyclaceae bacterium]